MNENYELVDFGRASEMTQSGTEGTDDAGVGLQQDVAPAI